ncbi:Uncharacterised protein [Mycobacterium tuberculosis]|uniref:Secreted protein n=1 Tax=Mycobacterium tuberculosis TaxID=1773 RepID=A0A916LBY8_MYCTX|nr:Uncharacterised protein [Mycobacterium tuberculosis]COX16482.1 Uncharacterised protein [Mycobacterium tuberculosis]COY22797.1 Uncharacterised protein [Mycobacterium tuberculosis]CPA31875.1 Uncharacterised protein [Mycobacterium tuberculosis]
MWPNTVTRTSLLMRFSTSTASCAATPVKRSCPNSSRPPSRSMIVPGAGLAPSATTQMKCESPRWKRPLTSRHTSSMSNGCSGIRVM